MKVLRWGVPVDDLAHEIGSGPVVLVATRHEYGVEVWTEEPDQPHLERQIRVVGTGQQVPEGHRHIGSTLSPSGRFVWHVYENTTPTTP